MTIKTIYTTSDNRTFDTKREATAHERTLEARTLLANFIHSNSTVVASEAQALANALTDQAELIIPLIKGKLPKPAPADEDQLAAEEPATEQATTA